MIVYHGSPNQSFKPSYHCGKDNHDYGNGFYLTEDFELAQEWSVCRSGVKTGWVHKYELDLDGLRVLDFSNLSILSWLAELMKHNPVAESKRDSALAEEFIAEYGIDSDGYDVIKGWRVNASYFYIATEFMEDKVDLEILKDLLSFGDLGIQYCLKSKEAFERLFECPDSPIPVDYKEFNFRYMERDETARENIDTLVHSKENKAEKVFTDLLD